MLQPWTAIQNCDEIPSICILLDINAISLPSVILHFPVFLSACACISFSKIFFNWMSDISRYYCHCDVATSHSYSSILWSIKPGKLLNHVSEMSCQAQPCITVWQPVKVLAKDTFAWLNAVNFHTITSSLACMCRATHSFLPTSKYLYDFKINAQAFL